MDFMLPHIITKPSVYRFTLIFICLLASCVSFPSYALQDKEEAIYVTLDVERYNIDCKNYKHSRKLEISIYLRDHVISVMYDRPSVEIDQTTVEELLSYLSRQDKKDLNLSLMVDALKERHKKPFDFIVLKSSYDPKKRLLSFEAKPSSHSAALDAALLNAKALVGKETILIIDG